jgi:hypothetical protein
MAAHVDSVRLGVWKERHSDVHKDGRCMDRWMGGVEERMRVSLASNDQSYCNNNQHLISYDSYVAEGKI